MSVYELRTIDGQSVLARVNAAAGVLEAAKTASMQAALNMLTKYTRLPYGFGDTFLYTTDIPVMTGETTDGTTITGRSSLSASLVPWKACDGLNGVPNDAWCASAAPTEASVQWLHVAHTDTHQIASYELVTRNDPTYVYSPNSWRAYISTAESPAKYTTLAGFAGDSDWTQVHAVSGSTVNTPNVKLGRFDLAEQMDYKHFILVITAANGGAARVAIGELNVYPGVGVNAGTVTDATIGEGVITPTSTGGGSGGDVIPTMTDYTSPSGIVFASTEDNPSTYKAWKAMDANTGTFWFSTSADTVGAYIGYAFEDTQTISAIKVTSGVSGYYPTSYKLQGTTGTITGSGTSSNAGSLTWVDIQTWSGLTFTALEQKTHTLSSNQSYKAYRLVQLSAQSTYFHVAELQLVGVASPTVIDESTIVSTADTASSAPTYAMGMIWLDADGATVTDESEANNAIRLYLSRDDGSTWDWLPLTDDGAVSGDVRLYSCAEKLLVATSGTAIKLKLTTHDLGSGAPDFALHGWGCIYNEGA